MSRRSVGSRPEGSPMRAAAAGLAARMRPSVSTASSGSEEPRPDRKANRITSSRTAWACASRASTFRAMALARSRAWGL